MVAIASTRPTPSPLPTRPARHLVRALRGAATTLAVAVALAAAACGAATAATVGDRAPDFTLRDLAGQSHSLEQYRGKVVVLEWMNPNCPFSARHAREKTMAHLADQHPDVVWLGINSTRTGHSDFMQAAQQMDYKRKNGIDYPVLVDATSEVGKMYGAKTTPHLFVIDEAGTLIYEGAIDDDPLGREKPAQRTNYVDLALQAHAQGKPVDPAATKPYGCSVKY